MKRFFISTITSLCLALPFVLSGCDDHLEINRPDNPDQPDGPVEWTKVTAPTTIVGQLADGDFGKALSERFTASADLSTASVAVFSGTSLKAVDPAALKEYYDKGNLIVVVNPDTFTDNVLLEDLGGAYSPYCEQEGILIYAFNNKDQHYLVYDRVELERPLVEMEETDISDLVGKFDEGEDGSEDDEDIIDGEYENIAEDGSIFYHGRLESFVDWINNIDLFCSDKDEEKPEEVGPDGYKKSIDLNSVNVNIDLPFDLNNQISKAASSKPDYLNCTGVVNFNFDIIPLYVPSVASQSETKAGDYYLISGTVNIYNNRVWKPYRPHHGGCRNRIVGYYMLGAETLIELLDRDDTETLQSSEQWKQYAISDQAPLESQYHLSNIEFYKGNPMPSGTEGATTYSDSRTVGFDLTASGKWTGKGPELQLSAGFHASWSHSVSRTITDISYRRVTGNNNRVGYIYTVNNIQYKRKWNEIEKMFPAKSIGDFQADQAWIWRVPENTNGITLDSDKKFYIRFSFKGKYGVYNWWRGASTDKKQEFYTDLITATAAIDPPTRKAFGVLSIKNEEDHAITNIRVSSGDFEKAIPSSYSPLEYAKVKLPAGTYRVDYDVKDKKTHKVVSRWKNEKVVIAMGANEKLSTKEISTQDFELNEE